VSKLFHSDRFNLKVLDDGMRKENDARFSALTMALKALEEWSGVALDKGRQNHIELNNLQEWETEIHVPTKVIYMDYEMFQQPKRHKGSG
jgi:hypothetical protein